MSRKKFKQVKLTIDSLKCHDPNDAFTTGNKDEIVIYNGSFAVWPKGKPASFKKGQKKDIDKAITLDFVKEDINHKISIMEMDCGDVIPNLDFTSNDNDHIGSISFINNPAIGLEHFVKLINDQALSGKATFENSGAKYTLKWTIDSVEYFEGTPYS